MEEKDVFNFSTEWAIATVSGVSIEFHQSGDNNYFHCTK